ncbi:hypothetical protein ACIRBX_25340 [Kitasatospora sp. NPDC096147]|uniref:hypothetical protein n=1 Tax=Kitasatospora sp. NPDC096147 TaxID=3364093 RepID=UPI003820D51A
MAGTQLNVLSSDEGWLLRVKKPGTEPELFGPCAGEGRAEEWLHQMTAHLLWLKAHVRGPWGCLAQVEEGWFTALVNTAWTPRVALHVGVQDADEYAARHLITPAVWFDASEADLAAQLREVEKRYWVQEGYRVLHTWAAVALGRSVREAYRSQVLGWGGYPVSELADRLGCSTGMLSAAKIGKAWDPAINRRVGVFPTRRARRS